MGGRLRMNVYFDQRKKCPANASKGGVVCGRGKGGVRSSFRAGFAGQDDRVSGLGDWVHGRGCARQVASACVGEWAGAPIEIGATERGDL